MIAKKDQHLHVYRPSCVGMINKIIGNLSGIFRVDYLLRKGSHYYVIN